MAGTVVNRVDPLALFDDLFRSFRTPVFEGGNRAEGFVPAVDAHRDGEDLVLRVDLPGIDPEKDVSVELSGRTLTVSGERHDESEKGGVREVRYGSFSRTVTLPAEVPADAVKADYEAGVLTVRVAGAYAEEKPQRIQVGAADKAKTIDA